MKHNGVGGSAKQAGSLTRRINACRRAITRSLRYMRVSTRLCIAGVCIGIVPLLAVSWVSYVEGSQRIMEKVSRSTTQTIEQASSVVAANLKIMLNDSIEIAYSDLIQEALISYGHMNAMERNNLKLEMSKSINKKYIFNSYNGEITLYTLNDERISAYGPSTFAFNPKVTQLKKLVEQMRQEDGKPIWLCVNADFEQRIAHNATLNQNSIVLARAIKSLATGDIIGFITIRTDERTIAKFYNGLTFSDDTDLFIINREGIIISTAGQSHTPAVPIEDKLLVEQIRDGDGKPFRYKVEGAEHLVVYSPVSQSDWYTVALIPTEYLTADISHLLFRILFTTILSGVTATLVFLLITASIVRPVRSLVSAMDQYGDNLISPSVPEEGNDEITTMACQFNKMTTHIDHLITSIRLQEQQKRELETRTLQAQINPHFFANLLHTVVYMAQVREEKNIETMVRSIIDLLNACMKSDQGTITVRESIEFMHSYATVQEYRMMGRFRIQYQIDPAIDDCLIPRFILQPIVENALIHGVEPSGRQGLIVIQGSQHGSDLHFSITDNGIGMSQEQIDHLFEDSEDTRRKRMNGIGISNVQNRLRLLYGEGYGLKVTSVIHVYTTVDITLPAERRGNNDSCYAD